MISRFPIPAGPRHLTIGGYLEKRSLLSIAARLSLEGYTLTLVDFDADRLAALVARFPGAAPHVLDQRHSAAVARFCDDVIEQGATFDVAIINAGVLTIGAVADVARQAIVDQIQVNLTSGAIMIQLLARRMSRARRGHILATVSMGGIAALKGSAAYSASKFNLRGMLWALRDELAEKGVRVSGLYPAGIDTPMLRHEAKHGGSTLNFVGDPVTVDDVVRATMNTIPKARLEVCVPASEGVTGRVIGVWPGLLHNLYPLLERIGESGRKKFLQRIVAD